MNDADEIALLKERVAALKAARLIPLRVHVCVHNYERVGGVNENYRLFFNGANTYIRCQKCGHRKRA